jgi:hypothetical protein
MALGDCQVVIDSLAAARPAVVTGSVPFSLRISRRTTAMPLPVQVPVEQDEADMDACIDAAFACLQSEIMEQEIVGLSPLPSRQPVILVAGNAEKSQGGIDCGE